jgi:Cdc6-like AAA superfamily ATPase
LQKIDGAFNPGDPALLVAGISLNYQEPDTEHWIVRDEQEILDQIVSGHAKRHYYLLIGEKGTGKTSMLLNAMRKVNGEGVAVVEAHADLEIFRIRLGKALDFEFHEECVTCRSSYHIFLRSFLTRLAQLYRKFVQH